MLVLLGWGWYCCCVVGLLQHDILWETLTARQHMLFYGRLKNLGLEALKAAVVDGLKEVCTTHCVHTSMHTALHCNPLLNPPSSSLCICFSIDPVREGRFKLPVFLCSSFAFAPGELAARY